MSDLYKVYATQDYVQEQLDSVSVVVNAKVPTTRTVNGKALSADITLSASDIGADASGSASSALDSAKAYTDEVLANLLTRAEMEAYVNETFLGGEW